MKRLILDALAVLLLLILVLALPGAGTVPPPADKTQRQMSYVPPAVPGPKTRVVPDVNNVQRGPTGAIAPLVYVIAPDHPGLTAVEQPQLYWFIADATDLPVDISLTRESDNETVYETELKGHTEAGFHCLDCAQAGVRLEQDKPYLWTVAVVPNMKKRDQDVVTSSVVRRITLQPQATSRVADGKDLAQSLLQDQHLWFDGVAALMNEIDSTKENTALIASRNKLLTDVGLPQVVDAESKKGGPATSASPN